MTHYRYKETQPTKKYRFLSKYPIKTKLTWGKSLSIKLFKNVLCSSETNMRLHFSGFNLKVLQTYSPKYSRRGSPLSVGTSIMFIFRTFYGWICSKTSIVVNIRLNEFSLLEVESSAGFLSTARKGPIKCTCNFYGKFSPRCYGNQHLVFSFLGTF